MFMITNRHLTTEEKYFERIKYWSYNGVDNIILREKDLDSESFEKLYLKIKSIVNSESNIIINSKIDVYKKVRCEYLHLPFNDFMKYNLISEEKIGVSVHSIEEGIKSAQKGATYILASHIFETKCKKGLKPKGLEFITELRKKVDCKIVALGGITMKNKESVIEAGADDVALMSYFF